MRTIAHNTMQASTIVIHCQDQELFSGSMEEHKTISDGLSINLHIKINTFIIYRYFLDLH